MGSWLSMLPEMRCLDEDEVLALTGNASGDVDRERARSHLDRCPACLELVALVGRDSQLSLAHGSTDPPAETAIAAPGTWVGRYEIESVLGRGGMGVVYAARDPELGRRVAVKLVRADLAAAAGGRVGLRLLREAQALADFAHPNVLTVYDVGTHEGSPFMAAELVEGVTLAAWIAEPRRWRAIVALWMQAGRGLAAAHAAGLVHRDFKPHNAIVGDDGRVRVIDFGLASLAGEAAGQVAGTPRYMAPEQRAGAEADARSDQYSLCASLEEALEHRDPPRWLRRLIRRGLADDPAARHPSMAALVDALGAGLRRRARVRLAAAAVALVTVVAAAGVWAGQNRAAIDPCSGAEAALEGAWSEARQSAVRQSIVSSQAPYAADVWQPLDAELDAYAARWIDARESACAATRIDATQSEALLDRRMLCLDRRRQSLEAVTSELAGGVDPSRALAVTEVLPPIEDCSAASVARHEPEPAAPADRAAIAEARALIARSSAASRAGAPDRALALVDQAIAAIGDIDYAPARAEAKLVLGLARRALGHTDDAIDAFEEAVWAAQAGGHDRVLADATLELAYVIGSVEARPDDAAIWRRFSAAAVRRVDDPHLDCKARRIAARAAQGRGELDVAQTEMAAALARCQQAYGAEHRQMVTTFGLVGQVAAARDDVAAAEEAHRRALSIARATLGSQHPETAEAMRNLGADLSVQKRYDEAATLYESALAIEQRALGDGHPNVAFTLNNLAEISFHRGDLDGARDHLERALSIKSATLGADHPALASTLMNLGDIARALGDDAAATAHYREAVRIRELALPADHAAVARARSKLADLSR